jgi:prepilin-type N-terminal cleavage/methylation domain-containing protein
MIKARQRGFSMLETIITIALTVILTTAFTELVVYASRSSRTNLLNVEALTYLQNEVEVVRDLAQSNWNELSVSACAAPNVCHPVASGTAWIFAAGKENLNGGTFSEWLSIASVERSSLSFPNAIVTSGGVVDSSTEEVTAGVSWTDGTFVRTTTIQTYAYNLPS